MTGISLRYVGACQPIFLLANTCDSWPTSTGS